MTTTINKDRLKEIFDHISTIGATDKGQMRLAYTKEDIEAHQYIQEMMKSIGMSVRVDAMGNVFGTLKGSDSSLGKVASGSHLDTVPMGGNYDGVVGVVTALAAMSHFQEGELKRDLELIVFRAEESSRFGFATMASKAMMGKVSPKWFEKADYFGKNFETALTEAGLDPHNLDSVKIDPTKYHAFIESHIEQGKVLEEMKKEIGIVKAIAAPTRYNVTLTGVADHSGATPMGFRKDALLAASEIALKVEEIASSHADKGTVGTVGRINIFPNSMNVVPGGAEFFIDLRGVDTGSLEVCRGLIETAIEEVCKKREIEYTVDQLSKDNPVPMNMDIVNALEESCKTVESDYIVMNSGAGHDAMYIAEEVPTAMLFIPSRKGISHNPEEYSEFDHMWKCTEVMIDAFKNLAK